MLYIRIWFVVLNKYYVLIIKINVIYYVRTITTLVRTLYAGFNNIHVIFTFAF